MGFSRQIWSFRARAYQIWNQPIVGHESRGKSTSLSTWAISTTSNEPQSTTAKNEGRSTTESWGTRRDATKVGGLKETLQLLDLMEQQGFREYADTCALLLQGYAKTKALADGKGVHAHIRKSGFEPNIFLGNILVSLYCKCGSIVDARQVFDKMPERNVISWTAMIAGLAQQGRGEEAFQLFREMQREGVEPNKVTFMSILHACRSAAALEDGKRFHAGIVKAGLESDIQVGTALVNMYCKCGSVVDARKVFDKMPTRDVVACISILKACGSPETLEEGKRLHAGIVKAGFESDVRVGNALVDMYCKCGSLVDARQMFDQMSERNVITYTAMVAGFAKLGDGEEAFLLFRQMQRDGVKPNKVTFVCILNACCGLAALREGRWVHALIIKAGVESDVRVGTALVSMYCKCGSVVLARGVFDKMSERNVMSWTAMIGGCAEHGDGEAALLLFQQMQLEGVVPNKVTFISILNACASLAALAEGKLVHGLIIKSGLESDMRIANALVDMYAKSGSVGDAQQVFDRIPQPDVVSWTAMINGCAQHGHGQEALQFFEQMQREGAKPDYVTFIGVLSACSHLGLVNEGRLLFQSMSADHGITPTRKHYGCMVDLLARAGHLDEAEDFINKMPMKPDALVWGTLLGACRTHNNVELAERAAKCVLKLDSQNCAV